MLVLLLSAHHRRTASRNQVRSSNGRPQAKCPVVGKGLARPACKGPVMETLFIIFIGIPLSMVAIGVCIGIVSTMLGAMFGKKR